MLLEYYKNLLQRFYEEKIVCLFNKCVYIYIYIYIYDVEIYIFVRNPPKTIHTFSNIAKKSPALCFSVSGRPARRLLQSDAFKSGQGSQVIHKELFVRCHHGN